MSPIKSRIVAALGAGAFGQAVNIGIQLLSLPAFLAVWNTSQYGVWLMLSALPAYLSMADVGLVTAVGNQMTMATGRGDRAEANRLFQSALAFMLIVCGGLAAVSLLLIAFAPLQGLSTADRRLALAALALTTVLTLFSGLADAVFRATGRYAAGLVIANLIRMAEWTGWMVGLLWMGSFSAVAVGGLLARIAGTALMIFLSARGNHGIAWRLTDSRLAEIRKLAKPALSFMAFPLANALNFQGMTLLVGYLFGPALLALFNTYRTLTRVSLQLTAMFGHSIWPELSRLYGQGGASAVSLLYRRSAVLCGALAVGLNLLLFPAAPYLLKIWTHGAIELQADFMAVMLLYAAVAGAWNVPRVLLLATNQHLGLAWWVVGTAALSLCLVAAVGQPWGLVGVGLSLVTAELVAAAVCFLLASRVSGTGPVAVAV